MLVIIVRIGTLVEAHVKDLSAELGYDEYTVYGVYGQTFVCHVRTREPISVPYHVNQPDSLQPERYVQ